MKKRMKVEAARNKISKIFRDNLYQRKVVSKRWKIRFSSLYKHKVSPKIFERKADTWGKKYNIELLIDMSGSMYKHNRAKPAIVAAANLAELLWPVSDLNIRMFNYLEKEINYVEMMHMKQMTDKDISEEMFEKSFKLLPIDKSLHVVGTPEKNLDIERNEDQVSDMWYPKKRAGTRAGQAGAGNREICSIVNAAESLSQKQGHKFIIIILDGNISIDYHSEYKRKDMNLHIAGKSTVRYNEENYRDLIKRYEKNWYNILAIGIWNDVLYNIKKFFTHHTIVYEPEEIYGEIVRYFEKFTHKTK